MNGNATSTYRNVSLLSVSSVLGPLVTTSVEIERRLDPILKRLRLPSGLLQRGAGVVERRNGGPGVSSHDAAVQAGENALREAGVPAGSIGLLINTSITKEHIEPSVATRLHHGLGLAPEAIDVVMLMRQRLLRLQDALARETARARQLERFITGGGPLLEG